MVMVTMTNRDYPRVSASGTDFTKEAVTFRHLQCGVVWKSNNDIRIRALPRIMPECTGLWKDKSWNNRIVIGDEKFHVYIVPQAGERPLRRLPGSNRLIPIRCDAIIMRVSENKDFYDHWMYTNISEPLSVRVELRRFTEQVLDILDFLEIKRLIDSGKST